MWGDICMDVQIPAEVRFIGVNGIELTGACETCDVGATNQTRVI